MPETWNDILERRVPYLALLSQEERCELVGHIHVLLAEKNFEGAGGLTLDDEIKVTIASQASLLLLHRDTDYFPHCDSIIVYPSTYVSREPRTNEFGIVSEGPSVRLGESWHDGIVVLAWDDVVHGARDTRDGYNVVLHEFAHQLDEESGRANGTPKLPSRAAYSEWAEIMYREYRALVQSTERHEPTDIDPYGATNAAEFFAVITEAFFERPTIMLDKHPDMYEHLKAYYRQDPAARLEAKRA